MCVGGRGGGAGGAAGWGRTIVRGKLYIFGDTFGAGPRNVYAVTLVVVRGGSEIPTIDTVGEADATVARCFVDNDVGAGGC